MRLDKYLKVSRIIKRRTVAKEVCDAGRIELNGRVAKAGSDVAPGDRLRIGFGPRKLEIEILATPETVRADQSRALYQVLSDTIGSPDQVELD